MSLEVLLFAPKTMSNLLDTIPAQLRPYHWYMFKGAVACAAIWAFLRWRRTSHPQVRTTQLPGPPSKSLLHGVGKHVLNAEDTGAVYETWAREYGPVYVVPWTLGVQKVVLCDPKAISHFYAKDTSTYIHPVVDRNFLMKTFGPGLLWANGEGHRRQRKPLNPAFGIAATRQLTPILYDCAHKTKGAWDALIESNGGESTLIEVQTWINHIILDSTGLAFFSHDFGTLRGEHEPVTQILDACSAAHYMETNQDLFLLAGASQVFAQVPTSSGKMLDDLSDAMGGLSKTLLAQAQKVRDMGVVRTKEEMSATGLLVEGLNDDSDSQLTREEVMAQMKTLMVGGYETSAITLTWALLELSRNPDVQTKLRQELLEHGADPTYDELTNGLPYLDAVVHEILRVYPAVAETERVAIKDDVIPLSEPVRTKSGTLVDSLTIAKGTIVLISIEAINRSAAIWGKDAKVFRPSRWLEDNHGENGLPAKTKEFPGHRHLLTFIDGPRVCLGKQYALLELKAVLTVLVKNFIFELRDGVDSKIEIGAGLLPRPKIAGEVGCKLPLRVRPCV